MKKEKRAINENFGIMIKYLREKQGLSLQEVQDLTGISPSYINRLEKGSRACPTFPIIKKLADAFRVDMVELLEIAGMETGNTKIRTLEELIVSSDYEFLGEKATKEQKQALLEIVEEIIYCSWSDDLIQDISNICHKIQDFKEIKK